MGVIHHLLFLILLCCAVNHAIPIGMRNLYNAATFQDVTIVGDYDSYPTSVMRAPCHEIAGEKCPISPKRGSRTIGYDPDKAPFNGDKDDVITTSEKPTSTTTEAPRGETVHVQAFADGDFAEEEASSETTTSPNREGRDPASPQPESRDMISTEDIYEWGFPVSGKMAENASETTEVSRDEAVHVEASSETTTSPIRESRDLIDMGKPFDTATFIFGEDSERTTPVFETTASPIRESGEVIHSTTTTAPSKREIRTIGYDDAKAHSVDEKNTVNGATEKPTTTITEAPRGETVHVQAFAEQDFSDEEDSSEEPVYVPTVRAKRSWYYFPSRG